MPRSHSGRLAIVLLALMLLAASCANRDSSKKSSTGGSGSTARSDFDTSKCPSDPTKVVSGDTIKLASSFPQSGLTAAFGQIATGWKSYFTYTNQKGGVSIGGKKYKIEIVDRDDQYNPQRTSQNVEQLVGSDGTKAFAVFGVLGTANIISIRDFLNDNCVPNLFGATGSPALGSPKYPWTIGATNPPYPIEAKAFADYLKQHKPDARVALLVQNDDFGAAYEEGFRQAIKGTQLTVAKVEKYAAGANEVTTQMTTLAATKADAFFDGATLLACPDALKKAQAANWKPITWVSASCTSRSLLGKAGDAAADVLSSTNLKDPFSAQVSKDADVRLYRQELKQYAPKADPFNSIVAYGWAQGALLVKVLENAKKATRLDVMTSVRHMSAITGDLLLDGVSITTDGSRDPFLGETVQVQQYDAAKKYFRDVGRPVDYEGRTSTITPKRLIEG